MENNILINRIKNAQQKFNPDIPQKEKQLIEQRNAQDRQFVVGSANRSANLSDHRMLPLGSPNVRSDFPLGVPNVRSGSVGSGSNGSGPNGGMGGFGGGGPGFGGGGGFQNLPPSNLQRIEEEREAYLRSLRRTRPEDASMMFEQRTTQFNEVLTMVGQNRSNPILGVERPKENPKEQKSKSTLSSIFDRFF